MIYARWILQEYPTEKQCQNQMNDNGKRIWKELLQGKLFSEFIHYYVKYEGENAKLYINRIEYSNSM